MSCTLAQLNTLVMIDRCQLMCCSVKGVILKDIPQISDFIVMILGYISIEPQQTPLLTAITNEMDYPQHDWKFKAREAAFTLNKEWLPVALELFQLSRCLNELTLQISDVDMLSTVLSNLPDTLSSLSLAFSDDLDGSSLVKLLAGSLGSRTNRLTRLSLDGFTPDDITLQTDLWTVRRVNDGGCTLSST